MKVYKFYKKPTEELKNIPVSEYSLKQKYPLYAITPEKKMAKRFRKSRDMNKFIEKVDDIDDDIVDSYILSKRERLLDLLTLETFVLDKTKSDPRYVNVVMTDSEFNLVSEYGDTGQILNYIPDESWLPTNIFSEKTKRILNGIYYEKSMCFAQVRGINEDGYLALPLKFDLFGIFLLTYGHILSPDFFTGIEFVNVDELSNKVIHS